MGTLNETVEHNGEQVSMNKWPIAIVGRKPNGDLGIVQIGEGGEIGGGGAAGGGKTESIVASTISEAHTIVAGAKAVTLVASSDFDGAVAGVTLGPEEAITFRAAPGNTLGAIAITCTAGSLRVWEQRESA